MTTEQTDSLPELTVETCTFYTLSFRSQCCNSRIWVHTNQPEPTTEEREHLWVASHQTCDVCQKVGCNECVTLRYGPRVDGCVSSIGKSCEGCASQLPRDRSNKNKNKNENAKPKTNSGKDEAAAQ